MKLGGADTNWTAISKEFEDLPEGDYNVVIDEIVEGTTKENQLPSLEFKLLVTDGEKEGRRKSDFVTLLQKDGKRNDIGYGRVRAYYEAVHGEGTLADGEEMDTDSLLKGSCTIVIKHKADTGPKAEPGKMRANVAKILPLG